MSSYARVENETVREIVTTESDIAALFHPALTWVDVTGRDVQVGWVRVAGREFAPPPPPVPVQLAPTLTDLLSEIAALRAQVALVNSRA